MLMVKSKITKKSTLMPISVPKTSSSIVVRRAALDKHRAHNSKLPDSLEWKLLYPDFQEVNNIPGSKHFFTVQKYKELGKSYQRINLYLYRIKDLEVICYQNTIPFLHCWSVIQYKFYI